MLELKPIARHEPYELDQEGPISEPEGCRCLCQRCVQSQHVRRRHLVKMGGSLCLPAHWLEHVYRGIVDLRRVSVAVTVR